MQAELPKGGRLLIPKQRFDRGATKGKIGRNGPEAATAGQQFWQCSRR